MPNIQKPIYKRVVLKITGEVFDKKYQTYTLDLKTLHKQGVELGIVVGGGNIIRGRESRGISKVFADQMGMLATVINAIHLQDILKQHGLEVRVQNVLESKYTDLTEPYTPTSSINHLKKGRIVIFAGGTGYPGYTTDYAAVWHAIALRADAILKGTKVDGLYKNYPPGKTDKPIPKISYEEAKNLQPPLVEILDNTTLDLLLDTKIKIPLHIFNILNFEKQNLRRVIYGEKIGTKIVP